jgi:hypothetical protein
MKHTYRVVLENPKGWRLTHIVGSNTHEQPYDRAVREINAHPEHGVHGPWKAIHTDRHS